MTPAECDSGFTNRTPHRINTINFDFDQSGLIQFKFCYHMYYMVTKFELYNYMNFIINYNLYKYVLYGNKI